MTGRALNIITGISPSGVQLLIAEKPRELGVELGVVCIRNTARHVEAGEHIDALRESICGGSC